MLQSNKDADKGKETDRKKTSYLNKCKVSQITYVKAFQIKRKKRNEKGRQR